MFSGTSSAPQEVSLPSDGSRRGLLVLWGLLALVSPAAGSTFNVRSYGAAGNGVTDDTAAIGGAIAAAQAAGSGSTVYLPTGTYLYSAVLNANGITIEGDGIGATNLVAADSNNSSLYITGSGPVVTGLSITTRTAPTVRNPNPSGTGIQVLKAKGFTITNVKISQVASAGILVRQSTGATGGGYSEIQNCEISGTLADGINVTQVSSYLEVQGDYIHDTGDDFISVVSYHADGAECVNILIHNNIAERNTNGRGIAVVGGSSLQIYNNQVVSTVDSGIYAASEPTYDTFGVDSVSIHNNLVKCCPKLAISGHSGVTLLGRVDPANPSATDLWVTHVTANDTVLNSATYGVSVGACTGEITLSLNHIGLAAYDGVTISSGASVINCLGNTIQDVGQNGFTVQAGATEVSIAADPATGLGNTICNTGRYGVYVNTANSADVVTIDSNIIDSVNRENTSYVDVICVEGTGSGATITIENNQYMNSANGPVNRLIESINTPLAQVSGNSSTITLPSLYTLM
jgi:hypothetical protein